MAMMIVFKIAGSFVLLLGLAWAALPGGFGMTNYRRDHGRLPGQLALLCWWLLLLAHPFALYVLWVDRSDLDAWLALPLALHVLFFRIFGRDVSTG